MKIFAGLITILLSNWLFSQDTVTKTWTFQKNIDYWGKWQTYALDAKVRMPSNIRNFRQNNIPLPSTFDTITDNPLRHGATYVALHTRSAYQNKIFLFADVYGEHRGVSYGLYDRNNTVLYPVMRIEASDTFQIFKQLVNVNGKAGQFLNERLDEGLMIYNIDVQGIQVRARFRNMELQYTLYGDLSNGIGLNIDDLNAYSIRYAAANKKEYVGFSWVIARPPFFPLKNFYTLNLFGKKALRNTSLYAQVGYRPFELAGNSIKKNLVQQAAAVVGITTQGEGKHFYYQAAAELRHYGWQFNSFYLGTGIRYRKPAADIYELYANTVGKYLYPLRKFSTPFNQWAVFTEYAGCNINALTLRGKLAYKFSKKIENRLDYDLNFIQSQLHDIFYLSPGESRNTSFLYPFFEWALTYLPAENFKASVFLSNKAMNLDAAYPTHYLLTKPTIGLSVGASF